MPNTIRFFEPKKHGGRVAAARLPRRALHKTDLDFTLKGAEFKKLFKASPKAGRPLPPYPLAANLLAAALDAGYGNGQGELLGASASEWAAVQSYMRARFECLLSLLRPSSSVPPTILRGIVVDALEMTEKIHMAFLLGTVYCRVANCEWTQHVASTLGPIDRFWHRQVATHQAVSLEHTAREGTGKVQNPDFLFRAGGEWFSAEAKGSFAGEDWEILRGGLQQASKLTTLKFFDLNAMAWQDEVIRGFTCTQAWFDSTTQELQVTHVDPPGDNELPGREHEWHGVADFAVLVRALQACSQFHALSSDDTVVADQFPELPDGVRWKHMDRSVALEQPTAIGLVEGLDKSRESIRLAVAALSLIVPVCAAVREAIQAAQDRDEKPATQGLSRRWNALAKRLLAKAFEKGIPPHVADYWKRLSAHAARQKENGLERWQTLHKDAVTTVRVPDSDFAILSLCTFVREQTDWARLQILPDVHESEVDGGAGDLRISGTEHGLFVATRYKPLQVEQLFPRMHLR
jgi:hypothetical protein